ALRAMYPDDELTERGWAHTVTDPLESLIQLTEAYTGSRRRFRELARYNKLANPDVLRIGDEVVVPLHWIPEELGFRPVALAAPLRLERDDATGRLYAGYTVARNDTLYSLLLRFTDRERADELNRMAGLLMKLNGIRGEGGLLAGRTLRMPIEWIVAERRVGGAAPVKRLEPPAPPPPKRMLPSALTPIHVIVDAGHGGRDPGAVYGRRGKRDYMVEHEVVYDIAERLVRLLDAKGYETYRTVEDPHRRYPKQKLTANGLGRERVLVTPPYRMDSAKIAVNMRVFLVNALYRRLVRRDGVDPQHIVLLSIHGDALA
ncbi:MAG: LysM peptidoglycan-binding domain-containing protein, partial [Gammaproteobacteria bacterium]|nr:LysM peptidoglycan-binding domain-containing protein [Gammaproteobacteria bacterium]NIT62697.1 LysM peptidoglycan-binding domain-containing protein [Gammaproteobacteria bacterium]NIY31277.1 LysM peptidoglycan-binding domain-containing protein [Gammaproteobacteria bacterium]